MMQNTNMRMHSHYFFTLCTELHVARMQTKFCRSYVKISAAVVNRFPALYVRSSLHCGLTLDLVFYYYLLTYLFALSIGQSPS
jgi:hypothetical protein